MNSPMEVDGNTYVTEDADDVPLDLSVKKEDGTETERKPVPKTAIVAASHRGPDGKSDLTRGGEPAPRHLQQPFVTVKQSNVQRASVVVRSPKAGSQAPKAYHAPAVSPLIADHVSSLDNFAASPDAAAYHSLMFSPGYNPYMAAAAAAVAAAASAKLPQPSLPLPSATLPLPSATLPLPSATLPLPSATLPLPSATLPLPSANLPLPSATLPLSATSRASAATQFHHHQFNQQQMQFQQQQQFQIQQQQQQQLQIQQQQQMQMHLQQQLQQQQQQLATYGGNAFDVNSMMMAQKMTSPLYVATSSPSSSSESGAAFPYGNFSMDCLPRSAYGFGYPYFGGLFGGRGTGGGVRFRGGSGGGALSDGRSDCMSPESITMADAMPYRRTSRRYSTDDNNNNNYSSDGSDGVDPEEVAAIYRQSDFLSFRQRYIDSLGPPKNFEKMRRSVPGNRKKMMNGQMQQHDQTYVIKRQKNNEAAKKSRDAKRQKFIENQISVMYLTKKVSEMKEIKRRLLLTM